MLLFNKNIVGKSLLSNDKFELSLIKNGSGNVYITIDGFLTEHFFKQGEEKSWITELSFLDSDPKVYNLRWRSHCFTELSTCINDLGSLNKLLPAIAGLELKKLWNDAVENADLAAMKLAALLENCKNSDEITIIGHSLGGRITLRTAAICNKNIKQYISLAAAISNDDLIINSHAIVANFHSINDQALKVYQLIMGESDGPVGMFGLRNHRNICLDHMIKGHSEYKSNLRRFLKIAA